MGTNSGSEAKIHRALCSLSTRLLSGVLFFYDDFMENYSQALTFGKNIIVAADLNCDMSKPRSPEAVALQDLCDSVNLLAM